MFITFPNTSIYYEKPKHPMGFLKHKYPLGGFKNIICNVGIEEMVLYYIFS